MTSLLVGLSWDGIQYPWRSAVTLVPIIVGLFRLVVSGWWQHYAKPHSLLPMSVFYNWSAVAAFYCTLVNGLVSTPQDFVTKDVLRTPTYSPGLYYTPFYLMSVRGMSTTAAGKGMLPAVSSKFRLNNRIDCDFATWTISPGLLGGWVVITIACGLLNLCGQNTPCAIFYVVLAIFGIGTGMILTSVNVGIQAISKPKDCAMAASMYEFLRSLGMPWLVPCSRTQFQATSRPSGFPVLPRTNQSNGCTCCATWRPARRRPVSSSPT